MVEDVLHRRRDGQRQRQRFERVDRATDVLHLPTVVLRASAASSRFQHQNDSSAHGSIIVFRSVVGWSRFELLGVFERSFERHDVFGSSFRFFTLDTARRIALEISQTPCLKHLV